MNSSRIVRGRLIGLIAACASIAVWIIIVYFNPYTGGRANPGNTVYTLLSPACFALLGVLFKNPWMLFGAFIWSFPISLYLLFTGWLMKIFGLTCALYLVSGRMMLPKIKRN